MVNFDTEPVEGDRIYHRRLEEYGVVTHVHKVYPYRGSVTVATGDGADLWELGECDERKVSNSGTAPA